ncbi:MAG: ABC transporter ATP-binding protein [Armatimonadota bacterium]|nr:ABC transporter ATP-binding protein [Armatimonadota bacterium]
MPAAPPSDPIIRLERVFKTYGLDQTPGRAAPHADRWLNVVHDFSFEIRPREFVSIIGPSGCGKTTVLFLIAGLREPSQGRVTVCGRSPHEAVRAGLSSVIFQHPVLFEWLTAEENVLLPLRMRDRRWWAWPLRRHRYLDQAQQALATVELADFAHYYVDKLSGGMQQRVAIARALTLNPQVLLMDEPFGALDEITRDRMNLELIRLFEERQLTIVFVTHSIEEAVFLSDRVVVMSRGPSPATGSSIVRVLDVTLPHPRQLALKEEAAFFQTVKEGREALREAQFASV